MTQTFGGARGRRMLTAAFALAALLTVAFSSSAFARYCATFDLPGRNDTVALLATNGMYVSVERGYTGADYGMLRARSSVIGPWEVFTTHCINPATGMFALRASNGMWVSVEMGYGGDKRWMLRARASAINEWEEFRWTGLTEQVDMEGLVEITSLANNLLVAAEFDYSGSYKGMLRARGGYVGTKFYVVPVRV